MVIVPEDETLDRVRSEQQQQQQQEGQGVAQDSASVQTTGDNLSRLDAEMYDIIRSKKFVDEREKCKYYLQTLRRYLFFKDNERHAEHGSSEREIDEIEAMLSPLPDDDIIESVPKAQAKKARLLLKHWRSYDPSALKWDSTGQVIIDGKLVAGSSIVELLNDSLRKKTLAEEAPTGRFQFAKFIGASETPNNLIENKEVLKIAGRLNEPLKTAKRRIRAPVANAGPSSEPKRTLVEVANTPSRGPVTRIQSKKKWLKFDSSIGK